MPLWLEVSLRTLSAIVVMFIYTRILGKRQISQLSLFEYITGISLGNLTGYISLDTDRNWGLGFVALSVWVMISVGIEFLQLKSKRARNILDGKPAILIQNGKILEDHMKKERVTSDELLEMLRMKDVFNISTVEFAIMDTSGELNVLLKKENQPLTASDLNLAVTPEKASMSIIMDGKILEDSLKKVGLNMHWLQAKLDKIGTSADKIYLAQVDSQNKLYLDPYDDSIPTH
ncbi:DUF421 domain-containing protein [Cohnella lupini]|uniref:Uncharacterized membrane protein YcaP (DUF421 family) n=1 Tax=Cohnella lupini TaxID=1294267 RepID=A0A3D9HYU0_9BACL|nr:DUF421 domain-containing protein [Cohnella lupini]RED54595.1 uncharacterized membrane protein YcaP (DUF421 family) [Cohnella lupini]